MTYKKTTWVDHVVDPVTGEVIQQGTKFTATRANKFEQGIADAHDLVENLAKTAVGNAVVSGLTFTSSGLTANYTAGQAYVNGVRFDVKAGSITLNATQGQYIYLDSDGAVKKTTSQATAQAKCLLWYFATDASKVITSTDQRTAPGISDGSITDAKLGNRTVDQVTPIAYSNSGTLTQILSWFAKVLKGITGKANWHDAPDITLATTKAHVDSTSLHVNSAEKLVTDLPSAYPEGITSFSLTTTTSQPWRDAVGLTGSHYAVVEVFKWGSYAIQRITFFYTADGTTKGTYQREGYTSTWRSWKKVAYESDLTSDKINRLAPNTFSEGTSMTDYPLGISIFYVQNSSNSWLGKTSGFFVVETLKTAHPAWGTQRATYHGNTATYEVWERSIGSNTVGAEWGPWVRVDRGITYGTANPSGGRDGDIYFQYE